MKAQADAEANAAEEAMASKKGKSAWSLSLPKRVTKQNYDENEYYRNALHGKGEGQSSTGSPAVEGTPFQMSLKT